MNGTFKKFIASGVNTSNIAPCNLQTYSVVDNNIANAYLHSSDFCRQLTNCTATGDSYDCHLVFLAPTPAPPTQSIGVKIVDKLVYGTNVCMVTAYCREDTEEGLSVICSETPAFIDLLLFQVTVLLTNLLTLLLPVPTLQIINQTNCEFKDTCPPII